MLLGAPLGADSADQHVGSAPNKRPSVAISAFVLGSNSKTLEESVGGDLKREVR